MILKNSNTWVSLWLNSLRVYIQIKAHTNERYVSKKKMTAFFKINHSFYEVFHFTAVLEDSEENLIMVSCHFIHYEHASE